MDDIVTLPDEQIFEAVLWLMARAKLVAEGAAAAPVAARAARRGLRREAVRRHRSAHAGLFPVRDVPR